MSSAAADASAGAVAARPRRGPPALALLAVVLAAGAAVRAVNWAQVGDGSIL